LCAQLAAPPSLNPWACAASRQPLACHALAVPSATIAKSVPMIAHKPVAQTYSPNVRRDLITSYYQITRIGAHPAFRRRRRKRTRRASKRRQFKMYSHTSAMGIQQQQLSSTIRAPINKSGPPQAYGGWKAGEAFTHSKGMEIAVQTTLSICNPECFSWQAHRAPPRVPRPSLVRAFLSRGPIRRIPLSAGKSTSAAD
jgi:hypothetical protein